MKMRYGSIRYNTSSSQKICRMESSNLFYDESGYYCETLYKSKNSRSRIIWQNTKSGKKKEMQKNKS